MPSPSLIPMVERALSRAAIDQNGFGGNCAKVATILDHVLQAQGNFVVLAGEHYEYADHVFLRWEGLLWDLDGPLSAEEAHAQWGDEDSELEDFTDPGHEAIHRMADDNGCFAGGFDAHRFHADLLNFLDAEGFPLTDSARKPLPDFSEPSKTTRRSPRP